VARNAVKDRERVASNDELRKLWPHLPPVLRLVLLTGCRPGEALNLRSVDIKDGHWCQPGEPAGRWKGTKNKRPHDVVITPAIAGIVEEVADRHYRERTVAGQMEAACQAAGITDPIRPHDLRRTWATRCTGAGHTTEQMDRCLNHVRRGRHTRVTRVYDRHVYRLENAAIWTKVAGAIMSVIEGKGADVIPLSEARNAS
jgi:integrase